MANPKYAVFSDPRYALLSPGEQNRVLKGERTLDDYDFVDLETGASLYSTKPLEPVDGEPPQPVTNTEPEQELYPTDSYMQATPTGIVDKIKGYTSDPFLRGYYSSKGGEILAGGIEAGVNPNEVASLYGDAMREAESYAMPDDRAKALGRMAEGDVSTFFKEAVSSPGAIQNVIVESLGRMAKDVPAQIAAGFAGPVGLATASGLSSFKGEYGAALSEKIQEKGVDLNDTYKIAKLLEDPDFVEDAKGYAATRGVPIAVVDFLTAGLAGKILQTARTASSTASNVARSLGEVGVQVGGGAGGEALASKLSTGEVGPAGNILLEGLSEGPTAIVEVPSNVRYAKEQARIKDLIDSDRKKDESAIDFGIDAELNGYSELAVSDPSSREGVVLAREQAAEADANIARMTGESRAGFVTRTNERKLQEQQAAQKEQERLDKEALAQASEVQDLFTGELNPVPDATKEPTPEGESDLAATRGAERQAELEREYGFQQIARRAAEAKAADAKGKRPGEVVRGEKELQEDIDKAYQAEDDVAIARTERALQDFYTNAPPTVETTPPSDPIQDTLTLNEDGTSSVDSTPAPVMSDKAFELRDAIADAKGKIERARTEGTKVKQRERINTLQQELDTEIETTRLAIEAKRATPPPIPTSTQETATTTAPPIPARREPPPIPQSARSTPSATTVPPVAATPESVPSAVDEIATNEDRNATPEEETLVKDEFSPDANESRKNAVNEVVEEVKKATNKSRVRTILEGDKNTKGLLDNPNVELVSKADDGERLAGIVNFDPDENGDIDQGGYDESTGKVYINADGVREGYEVAVAIHEVGHAVQESGQAPARRSVDRLVSLERRPGLVSRLESLAKSGSPVASKAIERADGDLREVLTLFLEEASKAKGDAKKGDIGRRVGQLVRDIVAAVKVYLIDKGFNFKNLSEADILRTAELMVRDYAKDKTKKTGTGGKSSNPSILKSKTRRAPQRAQDKAEDDLPSEVKNAPTKKVDRFRGESGQLGIGARKGDSTRKTNKILNWAKGEISILAGQNRELFQLLDRFRGEEGAGTTLALQASKRMKLANNFDVNRSPAGRRKKEVRRTRRSKLISLLMRVNEGFDLLDSISSTVVSDIETSISNKLSDSETVANAVKAASDKVSELEALVKNQKEALKELTDKGSLAGQRLKRQIKDNNKKIGSLTRFLSSSDTRQQAVVNSVKSNTDFKVALKELSSEYPASFAEWQQQRLVMDQYTVQMMNNIVSSPNGLTTRDIALLKQMRENMGQYLTRNYEALQSDKTIVNAWLDKVEKDWAKNSKMSPEEIANLPEDKKLALMATEYVKNHIIDIGDFNTVIKVAKEDFDILSLKKLEALYDLWIDGPRKMKELPAGHTDETRKVWIDKAVQQLTDLKKAMPSVEYMKALETKAIVATEDFLTSIRKGTANPLVDYVSGLKGESGILKKRSNIPEPIRKLLGEIVNPVIQTHLTRTAMATEVARQELLYRVYEGNEGKLWVNTKDRSEDKAIAAEFSKPLKGDGKYGPMEGKWVRDDASQLFITLSAIESSIEALTSANASGNAQVSADILSTATVKYILNFLNMQFKKAQIVRNPGGWIGDRVSTVDTIAATGRLPYFHADSRKRAFVAARQFILAGRRTGMNMDAQELMVNSMTDSAQVGEMQKSEFQTLQDDFLAEFKTKKDRDTFLQKVGGKFSDAAGPVKDTYKVFDSLTTDLKAQSDLVGKYYVYFEEKKFVKRMDEAKAQDDPNYKRMTENEIQMEAAAITDDYSFTYKRSAPLAKKLEMFWLTFLGNFYAETGRVTVNTFRTADAMRMMAVNAPEGSKVKEVLAERARERLYGAVANLLIVPAKTFLTTSTTVAYYGSILAWMAAALDMEPWDDEEEREREAALGESFLETLDPGERSKTWMFPAEKDGKYYVFDGSRLGFSDPATQPLVDATLGAGQKLAGIETDRLDRAAGAIGDLSGTSPNIKLIDALRGKTPSMARRDPNLYEYIQHVTGNPTLAKVTATAYDLYVPRWFRQVSELPREDTAANDLPWQFKMAAAVGFSVRVYDPEVNLAYSTIDYNNARSEATRDIKDAVSKDNLSDEEFQEKYLGYVQEKIEHSKKVISNIDMSRRLGASEETIDMALSGKGVPGVGLSGKLNESIRDSFIDGVPNSAIIEPNDLSSSQKKELELLKYELKGGVYSPEYKEGEALIRAKYTRYKNLISDLNRSLLNNSN